MWMDREGQVDGSEGQELEEVFARARGLGVIRK